MAASHTLPALQQAKILARIPDAAQRRRISPWLDAIATDYISGDNRPDKSAYHTLALWAWCQDYAFPHRPPAADNDPDRICSTDVFHIRWYEDGNRRDTKQELSCFADHAPDYARGLCPLTEPPSPVGGLRINKEGPLAAAIVVAIKHIEALGFQPAKPFQ